MKKIVSLVIAAALFCSVLISCNSNTDNSVSSKTTSDITNSASITSTDSDVSDEIVYKDDLPDIDMEGYTFRMYTRFNSSMTGYINVEEITAEVLDNAIYNRNRRIEERFNMKFTEILNEGNTDNARTAVLAGDDSYDMISTRIPAAYQYAYEGLLYSLNELNYIDLSKPYWDENLNQVLTVANKRYFAIGASNLTTNDFTGCLIFNKKFLEDLMLENPYALVDTGKWTYDKFNELARAAVKDVDSNGIMDKEDSYGLISPAKAVSPAFWIAAGNLAVKKDENDIPYFSMTNDEKFISTFQKIFEVTYDNNVWYKTTTDANVDLTDLQIFENNRALFAYSTFFYINNLRNMEADFGILPYPKLDERQDKYYGQVSFTDLFTVPTTNKNLDYSGIIIEALACESAKTVVPAYYNVALKTKTVRDEDSEKMLDIIFKSRVLDLGDTLFSEQIRDGVFTVMYKKGDRDLVSKLEKMQINTEKEINKIVEAFEALN
ncbi:hypothetical protein FACS1894105_13960 [Clostridia bacterium]|nr:hypothetical protein FACS1894105_13960 [Clostridia bacterium]